MNLSIRNVSFQYEKSSTRALDSITASFGLGWSGVVGENGSGKSTLMKILSGELKGYSGVVDTSVTALYCPQSTEIAPSNLEEFALDYRKEAIKIRQILRIEDEWLWRYDSLSQGEKKRIQVASALYLNPLVLALDEPTNHLDVATKSLLLEALHHYSGIGLLVSHDRDFLDSLIYQCLFLRKGIVTLIPGSYTQGKNELDVRHKSSKRERKNAQEELSHTKKEAQRRSVEASRTASRLSARNLDKKDSDGRAKRGLAVFSGQDGKTGLLATQMDKKVERAQERLDKVHVEKTYEGSLRIETKVLRRKSILQREAGTLSLGESRCLHYPDIFVGGTDHIGLWGPNGTGKTTFLNNLLEDNSQDYFTLSIPQELTADQSNEVFQRVKALSQNDRGLLLSIVARLNSPPERILSGDELSPGEVRKIMLAEGLILQPSLIVMDEPTNHLDIHSIEALEEVLKSCECALIVVSHDRQFIDAVTTIKWVFENESEQFTRLSISHV